MRKIYEGWKNHLIPSNKLKGLIQEVGNERMRVCEGCKYNSKFRKRVRPDRYCTVCGCTLVAKTKCLSCECPKGYWGAVVTEEQEDEMLCEK